MSKGRSRHPAIQFVLAHSSDYCAQKEALSTTTSVSLAQALSIGCLSRLDATRPKVNIWDPAAGSGFAGHLLARALNSAGIEVSYRGEDIDPDAVAASKHRFEDIEDTQVALGNTLEVDAFRTFDADLAIVDAPMCMNWKHSEPRVRDRQLLGEFGFGTPETSDSIWLFISLALEKLRPPEQGGGRVSALVHPSALSRSGASARVREGILAAGLLESVTCLPDALTPGTFAPQYLLTFANNRSKRDKERAMVADLRTQFETRRRHRTVPITALEEWESGLRTGRNGPHNRNVSVRQFIRRDVHVSRLTNVDALVSWRIRTHNDTSVDRRFLQSRYGSDSNVSIEGEPKVVVDFDPGPLFTDRSNTILDELDAKGWPSTRLSSLLSGPPVLTHNQDVQAQAGDLYVPIKGSGIACTELTDTTPNDRTLLLGLDDASIVPAFLAAWLNSDEGVSSRRFALEAARSGNFTRILPSGLGSGSFMRWADELIVPKPSPSVQLAFLSADEQLASIQALLSSQRASIWTHPERMAETVSRAASAFDDSIDSWIERLPFPVASSLWTARTASSPAEMQVSYLRAWEAIVTFHATMLLSVVRNGPGDTRFDELSIRKSLEQQNLSIERATFGTWVVIIEKLSKEMRTSLETNDADELARVRRAFGDLDQTGIERLVSKDLVKRFREVNNKRNRWMGHAGYISNDEYALQVDSLVSDLRELHQLLGCVWDRLKLVRAGSATLSSDGLVQSAEVAMGTRSPFILQDFHVGSQMLVDKLYLTTDHSEAPVPLIRFVQLRQAPPNAQYTSYFYNRKVGSRVRLISYQHGPESELSDLADSLSEDFGSLTIEHKLPCE